MSHALDTSTVAAAPATAMRSATAIKRATMDHARSTRGHPGALWHEAMHRLFGAARRRDAAVHHHAGERIGVEARELLVLFDEIDHVPGQEAHAPRRLCTRQ